MNEYVSLLNRQMINLLYILLIAMLAINTTSDVQKRENQHHEEKLKELTEAYRKIDKEIQQKKLESEKKSVKEKGNSTGTLFINDAPVELTASGKQEMPIVMIASSSSNQLPTPVSYLVYTPNNVYHGNVPVKRSTLLTAIEVGAAATEPRVEFKVISFETILIKQNGKMISTVWTEGNKLTLEHKSLIGNLEEGDTFHITSIIVEGPDGQKRQSNPINVIVIK